MQHDRSRSHADQAPPNRCLACGATGALDRAGYLVEHHEPECSVFDGSRPQREQDWVALLGRPDGYVLVRRLASTELQDVAEFTAPPTGRADRRRWSVTVSSVQLDGVAHLSRMFRRDGELVGALIDSTPMAGAR